MVAASLSAGSGLQGFPPPAASRQPRGAVDSAPGDSSGPRKALAHAPACACLRLGGRTQRSSAVRAGGGSAVAPRSLAAAAEGQLCKLAAGSGRQRPAAEDEDEEPDPEAPENGSLPRFAPRFNFTPKDLTRFVDFNIKGRDVIVFLHIQKTGGTTFGRHLVRNIRLEQPCTCKAGQKKCTCHRPGKKDTWLFSRFSTGWSCGLHADWTELTNCVPAIMEKKDCPRNHSHARNFYYITMLRDPVSRYLSEWKHVQRGATWKTSLHMCDGRSPTPDELPTCYPGDDWSGVSLREFMDCSYNLANNRQVRMLADLSLVGCYNLTFMNESERSSILLQSAKNNLKNMAFFGLTEFQRKTQFLFERTFNLKFISPFTQFNITRASNVDINDGARQHIEELNFLDMQLYEYAKDLFQQRYHHTKQLEHQRARQKRREARRLQREHRAQRWPKEDGGPGGTVTEDYNSQVARW
ncbi:heparan-sulfate 6-O-sulfotransferase 3 [Psammomys obesus]|uniref:heparan-sulfate 6-O-sulfotransferase 3 n=1 Tax=Psammomys obesus TaxID=48139 RepID=UPI002452BB7A|nr:heparan-sulfate 6-O-sulfotransferase 3 [Psammomys obesus]